ncbi:MAG: hypothetical protein EOP62_10000 [Sphingomonadales bacterium]|nr:MAG: hypothetical protein EOP62_10000 [Sphingomonadales bacterium]
MKALFSLALFVPGIAIAQEVPEIDPADEIVVSGVLPEDQGIVVTAVPHCYGRDGDPFDTVAVPHGVGENGVVAPDLRGVVRWRQDDQPILGPAIWQRTGNAIGDYRFRVPEEADKPICIGARLIATHGFASLRRIVPTTGMHGSYLRFSARVSTRDATMVRFYLVAGDTHHRLGRGGDTSTTPIYGTHGWRQVNMIMGPVPAYADHVSYGFLLQGRGDVWLSDAKLEVMTREEALKVAAMPLSGVGKARPN